MKHYHLYIDESGNDSTPLVDNPDSRYPALLGTLIEDGYYHSVVEPELEALKARHFTQPSDGSLILVRSKMVSLKGSFGVLRDPTRRDEWGRDFIEYLGKMHMVLFSVVIDKQSHFQRPESAVYHPYHYCLQVMLEQLRGYLLDAGGTTSVMVESRGRTEDGKLKKVYREAWESGTNNVSGEDVRTILSSKELALKKETANVAGLQIADLLAAPARISILQENNVGFRRTGSACTSRVNAAVQNKFNPYRRRFLAR